MFAIFKDNRIFVHLFHDYIWYIYAVYGLFKDFELSDVSYETVINHVGESMCCFCKRYPFIS